MEEIAKKLAAEVDITNLSDELREDIVGFRSDIKSELAMFRYEFRLEIAKTIICLKEWRVSNLK